MRYLDKNTLFFYLYEKYQKSFLVLSSYIFWSKYYCSYNFLLINCVFYFSYLKIWLQNQENFLSDFFELKYIIRAYLYNSAMSKGSMLEKLLFL